VRGGREVVKPLKQLLFDKYGGFADKRS